MPHIRERSALEGRNLRRQPAPLQFRSKRAEDAFYIVVRSAISFLRVAGPVPLRLVHRTDVVERELLSVVRIAIKVLQNIGKVNGVLAFSAGLQIRCAAAAIAERQAISGETSWRAVH